MTADLLQPAVDRFRRLRDHSQVWENIASDLVTQLSQAVRVVIHGGGDENGVVASLDALATLVGDRGIEGRISEFLGPTPVPAVETRKPSKSPDENEPDGEAEPPAVRLAGNARLLVRSARIAAAAARCHRTIDGWNALVRSVAEASGLDVPPAPPPSLAAVPIVEAVRAIEEAAATPVPPELIRWAEWFAGTEGAPTAAVVAVPVAGHHPLSGGFLADLRLRALAGDGLVEEPAGALRPLGSRLLGAVGKAWDLGGRPACAWSLEVRRGPSAGDSPLPASAVLDGRSLEAAASIGFGCRAENKPYDPGVLVLARVGPGRALEGVGHVQSKLDAAHRWNRHCVSGGGFRRAVVPVGEAKTLERYDIEVSECADLDSARTVATGYLDAILAYLDAVAEGP